MDRISPSARAALDQALQVTQPRRRWSDGPQYGWSEDLAASEWSAAQAWPAAAACASECMAQAAHELAHARDADQREAIVRTLTDHSRTLQKLVRLGSGRVAQHAEEVDLVALVRAKVQEMLAEPASKGAQLTVDVRAAQVLVDPAVASEVVVTALRWALGFSRRVNLKVDRHGASGQARLLVSGDLPRTNGRRNGGNRRDRRMNANLHWIVLRQLANVAQLRVSRSSSACMECAVFEFERTYEDVDGLATVDMLAGKLTKNADSPWVLAILPDAQLRESVLDLLPPHGVEISAVRSFEEARALVATRKPSVLVTCDQVEGAGTLRGELADAGHRCGHVHIMEQTPSFHLHGFSTFELARVGRNQVERELVPAVLFEIAQLA